LLSELVRSVSDLMSVCRRSGLAQSGTVPTRATQRPSARGFTS